MSATMYTVGVITSSDAGARGEREDSSGALIKQMLAAPEFEHRAYVVVPDDRALIERTLTSWADEDHLDLIVTTGGTGLTDRDVVPEGFIDDPAVRRIIDMLANEQRFEPSFDLTDGRQVRLVDVVAGDGEMIIECETTRK